MSEETTSIIIFGASGDLTRRKLVPALFNLCRKNRLPANYRIIGSSRTKWTHDEFRMQMRSGVEEFVDSQLKDEDWQAFASHLFYIPGSVTEANDYQKLNQFLQEAESETSHRLYYLSTAPRFFPVIVQRLGAQNMVNVDKGWRRVIIEKPFGRDLESAQMLNKQVHAVLQEDQIYRIDHYLAKESVQNLLVFRFGNTIFEPLWNRNYIESVQITAAESVDVGRRASYYEQSGVLRDMFQNHLMQLFSLVAMEPPASFEANAIRNEKVKVLSSVRPIQPEQIADYAIRARYEGYKDTGDVAPNSQAPTYAAIKLYIDNWRWRGVPFYLRSGKALKRKMTEIIIQFKRPPHLMFPLPANYKIPSNTLAICIQPDEGIHLSFEAKVPDKVAEMRTVDMEFHYADSFGDVAIPEAYERLLLEALGGDASLFTRGDGIEFAWRIIDPIIKGFEQPTAPPLCIYERGSWGPREADDFLARLGHAWYYSCSERHS